MDATDAFVEHVETSQQLINDFNLSLIEGNGVPDIQVLDRVVREICLHAENLPKEDRADGAKCLEALLSQIDVLNNRLVMYRDELKEQLHSSTSSAEAAKAYLKADGTGSSSS